MILFSTQFPIKKLGTKLNQKFKLGY